MGSMLESKGVQMMLGNLLKSAAPELMETVNSIGDFLRTIVTQLNRLEANQQEILRRMNDERHNSSTPSERSQPIVGQTDGVGNGVGGSQENR